MPRQVWECAGCGEGYEFEASAIECEESHSLAGGACVKCKTHPTSWFKVCPKGGQHEDKLSIKAIGNLEAKRDD